MTTFVTCYYDLEHDEASRLIRFRQFTDLAKSGVNICVYVDRACKEMMLSTVISGYSNVKLMRCIRIEDLFAHKALCEVETAQRAPVRLPYTDNVKKDTREFMIIMNSKIEFVKDAIDQNPFRSTAFAWIDFSITKIFATKNYVFLLRHMNDNVPLSPFLAIPGCCPKIDEENGNSVAQSICWRFCGGFFWGDSRSLTKFYHLYVYYFRNFLKLNNTLVWEVNFWAWLESHIAADWSPQWYLANHDDSMLHVPYDITSTSLLERSTVQTYEYPHIQGENGELFKPSSASYVKIDGKHVLNTRYVNYTIDQNQFYCHHIQGLLVTKNVMSTLDENLRPTSYDLVDDPASSRENKAMSMFNGMEDIRLYEKNKEILYLATSMSHSDNGSNSIVSGTYNHLTKRMENCRTLSSPTDQWCEKNWTPVVIEDKEFFIYQWQPVVIYNRALEKVHSYHVQNPIFAKFRGSSVFTRIGDNLLGLVHFSEGERLQRKYFHTLLLIDGKTMKPLKYSNHFHFCKESGIEFCTGFAIIDMKYQFWISEKDGSPKQLSVKIDDISLCNTVILE